MSRAPGFRQNARSAREIVHARSPVAVLGLPAPAFSVAHHRPTRRGSKISVHRAGRPSAPPASKLGDCFKSSSPGLRRADLRRSCPARRSFPECPSFLRFLACRVHRSAFIVQCSVFGVRSSSAAPPSTRGPLPARAARASARRFRHRSAHHCARPRTRRGSAPPSQSAASACASSSRVQVSEAPPSRVKVTRNHVGYGDHRASSGVAHGQPRAASPARPIARRATPGYRLGRHGDRLRPAVALRVHQRARPAEHALAVAVARFAYRLPVGGGGQQRRHPARRS